MRFFWKLLPLGAGLTVSALALLTILLLAACGGDDEGDDSPTAPDEISGLDPDVAPVTSGSWYRPGTSTTWQWQVQETLNTSYDVDLYEVDLFDTPAATIQSLKQAGRAVLCYFSAGSWEDFREDAGSFPEVVRGNVYSGFPDERWLDIRSQEVLTLMNTRLDLANVSDTGARDDMCSQARGRGFHTLVLPEDLDDSFRFSCDDSSTD